MEYPKIYLLSHFHISGISNYDIFIKLLKEGCYILYFFDRPSDEVKKSEIAGEIDAVDSAGVQIEVYTRL